MTDWKARIKIKHLLEDRDEDLQVKTEKFWERIKLSSKLMHDFIDEYEVQFSPESIESVEDFDEMLSCLYDFCDNELIWVDQGQL